MSRIEPEIQHFSENNICPNQGTLCSSRLTSSRWRDLDSALSSACGTIASSTGTGTHSGWQAWLTQTAKLRPRPRGGPGSETPHPFETDPAELYPLALATHPMVHWHRLSSKARAAAARSTGVTPTAAADQARQAALPTVIGKGAPSTMPRSSAQPLQVIGGQRCPNLSQTMQTIQRFQTNFRAKSQLSKLAKGIRQA